METYYGQRRTYFHNVRFSPEEERILQKRKDKYRYDTVSDFIRAAALDDQIKVVTVVHQDPIRKDYTVLIKSTVECIRVLEVRMTISSSVDPISSCPQSFPASGKEYVNHPP